MYNRLLYHNLLYNNLLYKSIFYFFVINSTLLPKKYSAYNPFMSTAFLSSIWFVIVLTEIPVFNAKSVDHGQLLHFAGSDPSLHCMALSLLGDARC